LWKKRRQDLIVEEDEREGDDLFKLRSI